MRLLLRRFSVAGGLLFFALLCVPAIANPQYEIYDLGVLQVDHMGSEGFGISPGGIGVGCSLTGDGQVVDGSQSFTWTKGGGLTGLPNVAGRIFCNSNSANGSGTVIGTCINLQGADELPVIWQNGVGLPLPLPTGYTVGKALSVNASGIVVGSAGDRGVIFTGSNAGIITQTTANGSYFTVAYGINDSGRIVGRGLGPIGPSVGIVHETSTNTTFSVGAFQGATNAIAYGVNNSGTVVGAGYPIPDYFIGLPFVWTEANGMVAIPLVQGTEGGGGYAQSVNAEGWVVGTNYSAGGPFLYDGDNVYRLIDLLPPGSGWNVAGYPPSLGISDDGTIVGTGLHKLQTRAWAMVRLPSTPTPTPSGTPTPTPPPITTRLVISAAYPNSVGQSFKIAVTARDQFNHTAVGYAGTVHFTSTSSGTLPANSTLTSGTAFFEVALNTPGQQTITATDIADSSITGTSNIIFVPAPSSVTPTPTATTPPPTPTPSPTPPLTPTPTPTPSSSPSATPTATANGTPPCAGRDLPECYDFVIQMKDSPDPVQVGDELTYSITVSVYGIMYFGYVEMTDTLPAGVELVSATTNEGTCTGTTTITCGHMFQWPSSSQAFVTLVVRPTVAGPINNTAIVHVKDSDPSNNTDTITTTVIPGPTPTPSPTPTPTLIVTNTNDSGPGSLRQAIADGQDDDIIGFDPALNGQTIILTTGELLINKMIIIYGPGPDLLTITRDQQAPGFRIFHVQNSGAVMIEGLTITGGYDLIGGGIYYDSASGQLTVNNCVVSGNRVGQPTPAPSGTPTPWGYGGGIALSFFGSASAIIQRSTISDNIADGAGWGGGLVSFEGAMTISQSTIKNNHARWVGAGVANLDQDGLVTITGSTISGHSSAGGIFTDCPVSIQNSTITGNDQGVIARGGSISHSTFSDNTLNIDANNTLELSHTILNNGFLNGPFIVSHGYNISSDDGGGYLTGPGDQINVNPLLGPLQDNGGPTFTHGLLTGSPAINAGDPNFTPPPSTDQRGYPRVYNNRIDIGSVEAQPGQTPSPTPTPSTAQALNISTRLRVETGDNRPIAGFIIGGAGDLRVVIRGLGPSLGQLGVPDFLVDPVLEGLNDNWQDDPSQAAQLTKLGLAPTNPLESAIVETLLPGAHTAILSGKDGGTGVGLVEVYNVDSSVPVANIELANISTRGFVQTGENVMIGGFILGSGSNSGIIVRGIGPSLSEFGVPNALADPTLELRDNNGALLVGNDNWQDDPAMAAQLSAHGLAPSNPNESGIFASLESGLYTAILAGKDGGVGVGLVEIYNVH